MARFSGDEPLKFVPIREREAVLTLDSDVRIQEWNKEAERLFGWSREEVLGQDPSALIIAPAWRVGFAEALRRFLDSPGEEALGAELAVPGIRRDASPLALEVTARRLLESGTWRTALHIRQRLEPDEVEARSQLHEEYLRTLLDASPYRMSYFGTDFRYRFVSVSTARWMGREPKDMIGKRVDEVLGKEAFDRVRPKLDSVLAGNTLVLDHEFAHPQDGIQFLRLHFIPHYGKDGRLEGIMAFNVDLTDLKRTEEKLRESTARLSMIFNNFSEGLGLLGVEDRNEFRILEANEHYLSLALRPEEEIVGRLVSEQVPPGAYPILSAKLRQVVETGRPVIMEYQATTMKGMPILEMRLTPIRGPDNRVEKILMVGKDITELRKTEESLRQAQKMEAVGRLAGGIAHDFNNLLTAINGFAEMAALNLDNPEAARGMLEEIRLSGVRAADLTRQLLAYSRRQLLLPKLVDLNAVLEAMRVLLQRLVRADIQLSFVLAPGLPSIRMDPGQLEQIILNLVINGCDAMPDGGRLTVETLSGPSREGPAVAQPPSSSPGHVLLRVSDTGMGMAPEVQARIFEPYFTTKEPGKGTGLGLAMVFGILNQSGGSIQVASEPGKGSRFEVLFPSGVALDEEASPPEARPMPAPERSGQVVLIVEDEGSVRTFAKQALEGIGFRIIQAKTGKEALDLIARMQGPLHLLLTDLIMPGMNGRELWTKVKSIHPETRILFMSGYVDSEVIPEELLTADAPFLQKPFSVQQLVEKVRDCLKGSAS